MGRSWQIFDRITGFTLAVVVLCCLTGPARAQELPLLATYNPPTDPTPLGVTLVDWDALVARESREAVGRAVFDNPAPGFDKIGIHSTALKPGMTLHRPHHHASEELLLVREGEVQVSINGVTHRAGPGFLVFFASHDVHGIENLGDKPATYYVINLWPPAARTAPICRQPSSMCPECCRPRCLIARGWRRRRRRAAAWRPFATRRR